MLIICACIGSGATALLCLVGSGDWLLAASLFLVANIGFAAGNIFYNRITSYNVCYTKLLRFGDRHLRQTEPARRSAAVNA